MFRVMAVAMSLVCGMALPPGTVSAIPAAGSKLTVPDVKLTISQAVGRARQLGVSATVAVVDREGNVLGVFQMAGANPTTTISVPNKPVDPDGLQGLQVPSVNAAVSKAGTAAYLSSDGNAFSTRTAGFAVREHFPPGVPGTEGGPLFGVQFSQLPCSDVAANPLPLGLSGDPGGMPIYVNGTMAGGIGIEIDGLYSVDLNPNDDEESPDQNLDERVAVAATRGYEAPDAIRADRVTSLPYVDAPVVVGPAPPFAELPGTLLSPVREGAQSRYLASSLNGVAAKFDPRFFPTAGGPGLSADEVRQILAQALNQARRTPSTLRSSGAAEVTISVVDANGVVLGLTSTADAPEFGFDVSAGKARTAAFFSRADAGVALHAVAPAYADAAAADGIPLNGTIAFSSRTVGFLSRPFLPDGVDGSSAGPFGKPINVFSPFNTGLPLALVRQSIISPRTNCTAVPGLRNGIVPLAGGVPLYRDGTLVGAIGISGDGINNDEFIAGTGATGFEAPAQMRADQFTVRGVRMPFVRYPTNPNL